MVARRIGAALQFRFEFPAREFDAAQFEKDNFMGVFDRDFHEILFSPFKKRERFSRLEFQSADARAHQLRAANFKFERRLQNIQLPIEFPKIRARFREPGNEFSICEPKIEFSKKPKMNFQKLQN
jgi:hypothetical protein